ncbi:MAG TPA: cytochrome b/b6 domain-containing protein [Allosphingosinicella sp.]|nr:cytochrome b/b6 domain-containing protein [Allosphingosinicella sp.]
MSRIAVWDLPTRLFHWALVLLIPALWWTGEEHLYDWHFLLGELVLGLILFRLFWGLFGSSTARFAGFVRGPGAILAYLRGSGPAGIGHNPLGALSVLALLFLLANVVGLGLFATDEDGLFPGPLARLVSYDSARILAERHEQLFWILVGFIALHVAAILYYLLARRDDLVTPMVTGRREMPAGGGEMVAAPLWRLLLAAGLAIILTLVLVRFL